MAGAKDLRSELIAVISFLYKAAKSKNDISRISGVKLRSVHRWTKKMKDYGNSDPPAHMKRAGRARVTSSCTS